MLFSGQLRPFLNTPSQALLKVAAETRRHLKICEDYQTAMRLDFQLRVADQARQFGHFRAGQPANERKAVSGGGP